MSVLCSSFTRNPMRNTSASIDHTHSIGNTPNKALTDPKKEHQHSYVQRNAYTDGIK